MSEDRTEHNQMLQRELYGETLHSRLGAVQGIYGLSQRQLALALGVSAPMLSQLLSARRVKMGNPRAHERMVALEREAAAHGVELAPGSPPTGTLDREVAAEIVDRISSQEVSETTHLRARHGVDTEAAVRGDLLQGLRAAVGAGELREASAALAAAEVAPGIQELLLEALQGRPES